MTSTVLSRNDRPSIESVVSLRPAWWLVPVPDKLDPAEAAIVVFNYMTTYQMLHRTARVRKGERLLVYGAAGGRLGPPARRAHEKLGRGGTTGKQVLICEENP
jgi:hypothetical protein